MCKLNNKENKKGIFTTVVRVKGSKKYNHRKAGYRI